MVYTSIFQKKILLSQCPFSYVTVSLIDGFDFSRIPAYSSSQAFINLAHVKS